MTLFDDTVSRDLAKVAIFTACRQIENQASDVRQRIALNLILPVKDH